jgi:uncharacterized membrane protein
MIEIVQAVGIGGCGILVILAVVGRWRWFWENHKAQTVVSLLGRRGAEVFYVALGLFLAGAGLFILMRAIR